MSFNITETYENLLLITKLKPSPRQRVSYVKIVLSGLLFLIAIFNARPPSEEYIQLRKIGNSIRTVDSKQIDRFRLLVQKILISIREQLDVYQKMVRFGDVASITSEPDNANSDDEYDTSLDDGKPPQSRREAASITSEPDDATSDDEYHTSFDDGKSPQSKSFTDL